MFHVEHPTFAPGDIVKTCCSCRLEKSPDAFTVDRSRKDGRYPYCRLCVKARRPTRTVKPLTDEQKTKYLAARKIIYASDPENHKARNRAWKRENREKHLAGNAAWASANKEKVLESNRRWDKANRHVGTAKQARRRAATRLATPKWADQEAILEIYRQAEVARRTGFKCDVDHIVPLISQLVCGLHVPANLQIEDAFKNRSKGNRSWPDMP